MFGKLELIDHGYEDLLISISPDIPADRAQLIISKIINNKISETCHKLILNSLSMGDFTDASYEGGDARR